VEYCARRKQYPPKRVLSLPSDRDVSSATPNEAKRGRCFAKVVGVPSVIPSRLTGGCPSSQDKRIRGSLVSRRIPLPVWSRIAEYDEYDAQLSLCSATTMRKFGKTVREKLDRIESRLSRESASTDQPGSHFPSRDGGSHLPPGDFPTEADFFRFRKQRGVNLGALYGSPIR